MNSFALSAKPSRSTYAKHFEQDSTILASDSRYLVRLARGSKEITEVLRLRHEVFNVELQCGKSDSRLEFDAYDFKCRHIVVIDQISSEAVGTYRLNTLETARSTAGFYSSNEFTIEDLPGEILQNGIELGRACIAREHRNTKVLFLLWKALLAYSKQTGKRYFFGCSSVFTQDRDDGARVHNILKRGGYFHERFRVVPKRDRIDVTGDPESDQVKLPALFEMYLRLGARVCGPPMIDHEFRTIDFFVVFDVTTINEKYRRMFS